MNSQYTIQVHTILYVFIKLIYYIWEQTKKSNQNKNQSTDSTDGSTVSV